jgi:integrase
VEQNEDDMARTLNRLGASKIATAKGPATLRDGGHLCLLIDKNNNKRWVFIYANKGREREISIGPFPAVSLADARKRRDAMNASLAKGEPPASPRQKDAQTFGAVAEEVIKRRSPAWRGRVSAYHWRVSIEQHCAELLNRPIASITQDDVLRVLAPLYDRSPSFAAITRARVEDVFNFAEARGLLPKDKANPADRRRLRVLLPAAPTATHRAALPYAEVATLVSELRAIPLSDARVVAARALEFVVLTALRVGEVTDAVISEIDFGKHLFIIPAGRMKAGREHIVPLPERAVEIIRELEPLWGEGGVVFAAQRHAKPIDGVQLRKLLKTLRPGVTVHGFRSSFRDFAGDRTSFPREVAEAALAHTIDGVEGAYRRQSALEKRRALMEEWTRYCSCEEAAAKVIALHADWRG